MTTNPSHFTQWIFERRNSKGDWECVHWSAFRQMRGESPLMSHLWDQIHAATHDVVADKELLYINADIFPSDKLKRDAFFEKLGGSALTNTTIYKIFSASMTRALRVYEAPALSLLAPEALALLFETAERINSLRGNAPILSDHNMTNRPSNHEILESHTEFDALLPVSPHTCRLVLASLEL